MSPQVERSKPQIAGPPLERCEVKESVEHLDR